VPVSYGVHACAAGLFFLDTRVARWQTQSQHNRRCLCMLLLYPCSAAQKAHMWHMQAVPVKAWPLGEPDSTSSAALTAFTTATCKHALNGSLRYVLHHMRCCICARWAVSDCNAWRLCPAYRPVCVPAVPLHCSRHGAAGASSLHLQQRAVPTVSTCCSRVSSSV
jgi:hypothetical protein